MDNKYTIEIHRGEDYIQFTVNGKTGRIWSVSGGKAMIGLLKKIIKTLMQI